MSYEQIKVLRQAELFFKVLFLIHVAIAVAWLIAALWRVAT